MKETKQFSVCMYLPVREWKRQRKLWVCVCVLCLTYDRVFTVDLVSGVVHDGKAAPKKWEQMIMRLETMLSAKCYFLLCRSFLSFIPFFFLCFFIYLTVSLSLSLSTSLSVPLFLSPSFSSPFHRLSFNLSISLSPSFCFCLKGRGWMQHVECSA